MRRRRLYGELLPVYLMALFAVVQAVAQVAEGDWPVALQLGVLAAYVVVIEHIQEARRVLAYRAGYTRGVVMAFEEAGAALAGRRLARRPAAVAEVHPDDGWRP